MLHKRISRITFAGLVLFLLQGTALPVSALDPAQEAVKINNEGMVYVDSGDYAKALENFRTACEMQPTDHLYQCNLGYALMKNGQLDEAISHLEKSIELKADFPLGWLNLGVAREAHGELKSAVECFQKYVQSSPPSEQVNKIKAHINTLNKESSFNTGDVSETDYIESIKARNKLRWPKSRMPIKIYMKPGDGVPGYKPEYKAILKKAFDEWMAATNGNVTADFVSSPQNADITTEWTVDTKGIVSISEGGDTRFRGDGQGMVNAQIRLLLLDPKPQKLTPELMLWVSLHEVGHALGLLGHSPNPKDVMYHNCPMDESNVGLTARDTATALKFYTEDLGESWLSLNDAGIAAAKGGDYPAAVKNYERAIELEPNEKIPKQNLVRAQYRWAVSLIQNGDMKSPEEHFKKALDIERKNRDENLPTLIKSYAQYLRMLGRNKEAVDVETFLAPRKGSQ